MGRPRNTQVRVYVVEYRRDKLMLRIVYPDGRQKHESTGTDNKAVAERMAGVREEQLRKEAAELALNGPAAKRIRKPWGEFRIAMREQLLPALAPATRRKYEAVFSAYERNVKPVAEFIDEVTTPAVSEFIAAWRLEGAAEATLFSSLGHFRAGLKWAKEQGWLKEIPIVRKPTIDDEDASKGRGLTDAEFQLMLDKTKEVVKAGDKAWKHLQRGLFLSGLRLSEALMLSWDIPGTIRVDLSGRFPMLDIPRKRQKKRKAELWPITPDFAGFLLETPETERTGYVFHCPMPIKNSTEHRRMDSVSKIICEIGETAGIVVNDESGKFASAHDFRRSFGIRWSDRLLESELQVIMRHADIKTTQKFYTRKKSDVMAEIIWQKGNVSGNKPSLDA